MSLNRYLRSAPLLLALLLGACAGLGVYSSRGELEQGLTLFNQGRYQESIAHFDRAIELDPNNAEAHLYKGKAYVSTGRWVEAVLPLREAYRLLPEADKGRVISELFDALIRAAVEGMRKGDLGGSIALLREAKSLAPRSGRSGASLLEAFLEVAGKLLAEGRFQEALEPLREAFQLAPQSPQARSRLVEALTGFAARLLSQGRGAEAISAYSEVLALEPGAIDAYLGLAKAYYQSGNFSDALEALARVLRQSPSSQEAQELYRSLLSQ